jgi:chromosome segregation ATPase
METSIMQTGKQTILLLILSISVFFPSGCTTNPHPAQVTPQSAYTIKQPGDSLAKRFQDTMPQGATAIESAMELSEKYASLSEQAALLKQQNQDVTSENQKLKEQILSIENQLKQTQKELTEANDFLIEMRIELNNWKADVLGFRDEMRDAETAQLEALLKILKALGGDVQETAASNNAGSIVASLKVSE